MLRNLIFGSSLSFVLSFISLLLVARVFSFNFISDLKAVALYGGLFSTILTCQLHSALLFFSTHKGASTRESLEILAFTSIFFVFVAVGGGFYFIFPFLYELELIDETGLFFFSVYVSCNLLFIMTPVVFSAMENSRSIPGFMFAYAGSGVVAILVSFFLGFGINEYSVINLLLVVTVLVCSQWRRYFYLALVKSRLFYSSCFRDFYNYAKKISAANIFDSLSDKADKIIASKFYNKVIFAKYSVLCFENPLVNLLLNSYGIFIIKMFAGQLESSKEKFIVEWENVVRSISFITYPIAAFLFFNANWFVNILFGPRYVDAEAIFKIYTLVAIVRPAPFQALLRMQGLARCNVNISFGFLCVSLLVCMFVIYNEMPIVYLPLSYFMGWVVFNLSAIIYMIRNSSLGFTEIACHWVCVERFAQAFLLAYCSDVLFPSNGFLEMFFFGLSYLVLVLVMDKHIRMSVFRLIEK